MALSEIEMKQCEKAIAAFLERRRPPAHIRDKLDLGFRITDQSVEIFEIRPNWRNPKEKLELAVAKATFVRTQDVWRVYWQRADLQWHRYDPDPEVTTVDDFLRIVDEDEYCCFFG